MKLFSIFDSCAAVHQRPFAASTEGEASRAFTDLVADREHPVGAHPEDYSLVKVGFFDEASGKITPCVPEGVMTGLVALSLIERRNNAQFDLDIGGKKS